jgi:hypothetical protein
LAIYGKLIITQSLPMNIFDIHSNITGAYEEYIRSFVNISDERIRQEVELNQRETLYKTLTI